MSKKIFRRDVLKGAGAACAAALIPRLGAADAGAIISTANPRQGGAATSAASQSLHIAGQEVEIQIASVSAHTVRITALPLQDGKPGTVPDNGSLVRSSWGPAIARLHGAIHDQSVKAGNLTVKISAATLSFAIGSAEEEAAQQLTIDPDSGAISFISGDSPILGFGEGGPQFDRRGDIDRMRSGQGGYELGTHGGRLPVPWLIGTAGWAIFFNQPFGTFDLTGPNSKFQPKDPESALPLDIFVVVSREPATIMAEYARLTGHAELPPLWTFGYQQSHRTLASKEEILTEAKMFREKKLPCDTMIYLGTGFCPSGWNTENGSFSWNSRVFDEPKQIIQQLHDDHFKSVYHVVILSRKLHGTVHDPCDIVRFDEGNAACYWDTHRKDFALGIDGWWPDEGDPLDIASRLTRNRMYWEGPQIDRPNERPYALHRNGYAGMQRYASFLWSGDVYSKWETLKTHIPNAINTSLTGIPYWGTDIGGFVPTKEFTAELYLRWFQFGSFCTLFRCHGRAWKLRLPWGWDTGEIGPTEVSGYGGSSLPDPSELHNAQVEPICRKYLELRYRMLPYLYSAVRECTKTGMPVMRGLWLHYADDPTAVARGDEFLWGRDVLVAPVVEKGATSRSIYLPHGAWYDFWTNERMDGGREISRAVDLETMPLFVRAGSILPLGPVKQYTEEKVDEPLTVTIYPGADASFLLYEDDGRSFNYRKGEWMGIQMTWNDAARTLKLNLAPGSRMLPPLKRNINVKLGETSKPVVFEGHPVEIKI
ncbi:MAG TPA: TIM-barrel domain-containing protein [Candidatus Acidoferrales bacterium]|nr:TIM-barrel domain-containing protein [Candidatus Acidoferrales bacterium]